jgi:hypothetical protein
MATTAPEAKKIDTCACADRTFRVEVEVFKDNRTYRFVGASDTDREYAVDDAMNHAIDYFDIANVVDDPIGFGEWFAL